ncbi:hypothetical protein M2401_001122 [Pseudomonas sp. JUb42]|uniref:hypothetical protein n=1 Tax=Pseudomonas sp. JUb42 TaxID=2940611 RepID=UPI0021682278|nr:hypothetical protein [Pseudomonas sp. JUb42]MCS3467401.1 hypothetical protein [Pseudomonas sp. JUb42]
MSKTIVTFAKNWRGYAAGETAGFSDATATALIDAAYAEETGKKGKRPPRPATKPLESKPDLPLVKVDTADDDEKP